MSFISAKLCLPSENFLCPMCVLLHAPLNLLRILQKHFLDLANGSKCIEMPHWQFSLLTIDIKTLQFFLVAICFLNNGPSLNLVKFKVTLLSQTSGVSQESRKWKFSDIHWDFSVKLTFSGFLFTENSTIFPSV